MKYRGNQAQPYDPETGTGLIGRVVGPSRKGKWFVIANARYDEAADVTHAELQLLPNPNRVFDRLLEQSDEPTDT